MQNSKKAAILFSLLFLFSLTLTTAAMPAPTEVRDVAFWELTKYDGEQLEYFNIGGTF